MRPLEASSHEMAYPASRSEVSLNKVLRLVSIVLLFVERMLKVFKSYRDLENFEREVKEATQELGRNVIELGLEVLDEQLMRERDERFKEVAAKKRKMVTLFGDICFKRRLYRDERTGESVFLLDKALGLEERERLSPGVKAIGLKLATEMPFGRAARLMGEMGASVSVMTIWKEVKRAGERAAEEAQEMVNEVFEGCKVPEGEKTAERLCIEADGVVIPQQRSKKKRDEVKLIVAYEGKEGRRRHLVNRKSVAGRVDGERIWEEASAYLGETWDLSSIGEVHIGGDGAGWVKAGLNMFPKARYCLDRYHLRERLTEALACDSECYEAVCDGIARLDKSSVTEALQEAIKGTHGTRRKRMQDLRQYLLDNWGGIRELPEEERLGAIEGQVRHTIARRMKRIGARWTPGGTDRMARLLAARSNGELSRYLSKAPKGRPEIIRKAVDRIAARVESTYSGIDTEAWLNATLPALKGPFSSRPWVKFALRQIVHALPRMMSA